MQPTQKDQTHECDLIQNTELYSSILSKIIKDPHTAVSTQEETTVLYTHPHTHAHRHRLQEHLHTYISSEVKGARTELPPCGSLLSTPLRKEIPPP